MNAPSLFDVLPPKRAATLEETRLTRQQTQVLLALVDKQAGDPVGSNAFELQAWMQDRKRDYGIERNAIGSRFKELGRDFGFVVEVGRRHVNTTGRGEKVFAPTADGVAWARTRQEAAA